MNISAIKAKLESSLDEIKGLIAYAEKVEEKSKSTASQYKILLQRENALVIKDRKIVKDREAIGSENKRVLDQRAQVERDLELLDKQNKDFKARMGEMRAFRAKLDEKLLKSKELDQKEIEVNQQETDVAEKSKKVARREGLVAKEKEILRERKLQLDVLEEKRKVKLARLNKMLGE